MSQSDRDKGSSFQAVLVGFLTSILGSIAVSVLISATTRVYLSAQGLDPAQIKYFFAHQFEHLAFALSGLPATFAVAGLAGYMTAKTANRLEYFHALAMIMLVLLAYYGPTLKHVPLWFFLLSAAGSVSAALLGAGRYKRAKR